MLRSKIVSSLENCFLDNKIDDFNSVSTVTALKNERISFQYITEMRDDKDPMRHILTPKIEGDLAKYATIREVRSTPVSMPTYPGEIADNYLRTEPGLFPDLLQAPIYDKSIFMLKNQLKALWIEIDLREVYDEIKAGKSTLKLYYDNWGARAAEAEVTIDIIDALLPEQELILTQWFYCDCLAQYYNCEVWSERHWEIIESFAKTAKSNGINLLLTPVFTPSLDTREGGERLTTQLVQVTKNGDKYSFNFDLLDRWVDMCDRVGIKYFEISHFFTQWGARSAPKVMATVDGKYKRIFGWETSATSEEYTSFLRTFIVEFLNHMKARGDDKRCYFHISDEPSKDHIEFYKAAKESVADLLEGYTIMDALSSYEFYQQGIVSTPIPCSDHIKPFLEGKVPGLWTYYCCSQWKDVSNRFIAAPSYRNRSIGMQMYKYDIVGFLNWGYNFYNSFRSYAVLDPYGDSCGHDWVPGGDAYSVYPASDGTALESLRIIVFYDALQDMMAMRLAEKYCGKEAVVKAIEDAFGKEIAFDVCARSTEQMQAVRDAVNELIRKNI